jgi:hypothetical protein
MDVPLFPPDLRKSYVVLRIFFERPKKNSILIFWIVEKFEEI